MHAMLFTERSTNTKTGPIPVSTTDEDSCPDACPLKRKGCYAKSGPLAQIWRALSRTTAGDTFKNGRSDVRTFTWQGFIGMVRALDDGTLWRHNQAGDLPGKGDQIDGTATAELADANRGKRGWTYSHKPITGLYGAANAAAILAANLAGFTVNLSADNLTEADELADAAIAPVVVLLPKDVHGNVDIRTPAGRRVTVCPATYREDVNCKSCKGLCQRRDRTSIVGFPAHGASKNAATVIAASTLDANGNTC